MPMSEQTVEGECPACGKTVRYTGYVPRIFLCLDCGGEEPHADGVYADDEGRLHYEEPDDEKLVTDGGEEVGRATPQYEFNCPYCAFFERGDDSLRLQRLAKSHIRGWHA
jgi:predicted RNA-binding Zn-ribbon protein involved in translation (DUF1610 family)